MNIEKHIRKILFIVVIIIFAFVFFKLLNEKYQKNSKLTYNKIQPPQTLLNLQQSFEQVVNAVKPAVVFIQATQYETIEHTPFEFFFGDPFEEFFEEFFGVPKRRKKQPPPQHFKRRIEGFGSGVIIDSDGYVLTNEHVVRNAEEITITLYINGKKKYKGKVVGRDSRTDLAIIKINTKEKLPSALLGDSDNAKIGDWVIAIGAPFNLEQTVTAGIISAQRQSLTIEGRIYTDLLQTDASINRGNSGGPLVNLYGEVIGINTAIYAPTGVFAGIGFAIPINKAKAILGQLITKGKVERGWLGIEIKEVDDVIVKQFGLTEKSGALINNVLSNTPAQKAGLKRGDVIIEVNGIKIKNTRHLQDLISGLGPKEKAKIKIIRNRKEMFFNVVTGEFPQEPQKYAEKSEEGENFLWNGVEFSNLNTELIKRYNIPDDARGVVIVEIQPDSKFAQSELLEGDLVRSINNESTENIGELKKVLKNVKLAEGVVFDIIRDGKSLYITFSIEE